MDVADSGLLLGQIGKGEVVRGDERGGVRAHERADHRFGPGPPLAVVRSSEHLVNEDHNGRRVRLVDGIKEGAEAADFGVEGREAFL